MNRTHVLLSRCLHWPRPGGGGYSHMFPGQPLFPALPPQQPVVLGLWGLVPGSQQGASALATAPPPPFSLLAGRSRTESCMEAVSWAGHWQRDGKDGGAEDPTTWPWPQPLPDLSKHSWGEPHGGPPASPPPPHFVTDWLTYLRDMAGPRAEIQGCQPNWAVGGWGWWSRGLHSVTQPPALYQHFWRSLWSRGSHFPNLPTTTRLCGSFLAPAISVKPGGRADPVLGQSRQAWPRLVHHPVTGASGGWGRGCKGTCCASGLWPKLN